MILCRLILDLELGRSIFGGRDLITLIHQALVP